MTTKTIARMIAYAEIQIIKEAFKKELNWGKMNDEERYEFINVLIDEEDRICKFYNTKFVPTEGKQFQKL